MKISIALCTYNGSKFLKEQLLSISGQSRLPYEVVICDDGSVDDSVEIIRQFSYTAPFPVYIYQGGPPLGPAKNFEKAVSLCNGDVIALSDQDDLWNPQKLEKIGKIFLSHSETCMVFSNASVVDEQLGFIGYSMWERTGFDNREQRMVHTGQAIDVFLKHYVVTGATLAFRSTLKPLILPIPLEWNHDAWIAFISAFAGKVAIIEEPLIKYRQHGTNVSGGMKKKFLREITDGIKTTRQNYYTTEVRRFELLYDRVLTAMTVPKNEDQIAKINEKLGHLKYRANLPGQRFFRLPGIVKELASLRYKRFARNWQSVAADIFLK